MAQQTERRQHPRVPLTLSAEIRQLTEDHHIPAITANVSMGGACLHAPVVVEENAAVFVALEAPPSLVLGTARIVAADLDLEQRTARLHLQFRHLSTPNRQRLEALLAAGA
jgi:c-di-GMP-binding flagellar brake protein YcgR